MKIFLFFICLTGLLQFPAFGVSSLNTWNTPDHGYFDCQEKIDATVSTLSQSAALINYNGELFYFINYSGTSPGNSIILRKLQNESPDPNTLHYSYSQQENITNLENLSNMPWQPAPVVFNNSLLLFVLSNSSDVGYSRYNSGADTWSPLITGPSDSHPGHYMAATVVGDKLCLITQHPNSGTDIFWTRDLISWNKLTTDISPNNSNIDKIRISAITRTYMESGELRSKLMIAYLDGNSHPHCADFKFDDNENLVQLNDVLISTETTYSSVVLVEGSVFKDPLSTGNCLQAFLKLDSKDNGYCRYRIQRFQSKENGAWTKSENNLLRQNYQWASGDLNLTATTFPVVQADGSIRNFICLLYRSYDTGARPLHCAFSKSDYFQEIVSNQKKMTLSDPANVQYLGYIEGVPPYHVNDRTGVFNPYLTEDYHWISELEYTNSSTTSSDNTLTFDIGASVSCHFSGCRAELEYQFGKSYKQEFTTTIKHSLSTHAGIEPLGYYITYQPILCRNQYNVYDASGSNLLYHEYYFYLKAEPTLINQPVSLQQSGLDPSRPETYTHRGINFSTYDAIGSVSNSWTGQAESFSQITVETNKSVSNSNKISLKVGRDYAEIFEIEAEGSVELEMSSKTKTGNEIKAYARLNEPDPETPTDVTNLGYNVWWIKKTPGNNNWWLYPGQDTSQNTWCVTYEVNFITYVNGDSLIGDYPRFIIPYIHGEYSTADVKQIPGADLPAEKILFELYPNSPNPFRNTTRIRYQVGESGISIDQTVSMSQVVISIYDFNGRKLKEIVNEQKEPGYYETEWDASDSPAGMYFCIYQSADFREVKKLIKY